MLERRLVERGDNVVLPAFERCQLRSSTSHHHRNGRNSGRRESNQIKQDLPATHRGLFQEACVLLRGSGVPGKMSKASEAVATATLCCGRRGASEGEKRASDVASGEKGRARAARTTVTSLLKPGESEDSARVST